MTPQSAFARLAREDGRGALVTVIDGEPSGAKLLVHADGTTDGTLGDPQRDAHAAAAADELMWAERSSTRELPDGAMIFVDVTFPAPRLVVVGAVDFTVALCRVATALAWHAFVVDPRGRFAAPERFPDAEAVYALWPRRAFAELGGLDRGTAVAVLTHDPKIDDEALVAALESDAGYIGAMGSRRAQADRRERLLAAGIAEEQLQRISAPIGLDLGALTPEETALSVVSEIVALKRGHGGGRLKHAKGRIHEVTG